jgi:nicotinate-nucleotide--dimethylbenzimidazole phosphoribosyltransferase
MFEKTLEKIKPIDKTWLEKAEAHQLKLTKPPQSLGRLEEIANRICAIQESLSPNINTKRIVICAGSHGVCDEGVSPYPAEVTAQMVANFLNGGAAINALARVSNIELDVVDVGVKGAVPNIEIKSENCRFISSKVAEGTRNFVREAAMTEAEMMKAIEIGISLAMQAKQSGVALIGLGEMGIGNTTSASAITSALTNLPPEKTVGRGTGADDAMLAHKIEIVKRTLEFHDLDAEKPLEVLQKIGGLEIACLVGVCFGAASERIAVVSDGFIATAAVALAITICPPLKDYVFASHLSVEIGHSKLLEYIEQKPFFDLEMRLGEGTGAALAMNIFTAAVAAFNEMATFEQASVSNRR